MQGSYISLHTRCAGERPDKKTCATGPSGTGRLAGSPFYRLSGDFSATAREVVALCGPGKDKKLFVTCLPGPQMASVQPCRRWGMISMEKEGGSGGPVDQCGRSWHLWLVRDFRSRTRFCHSKHLQYQRVLTPKFTKHKRSTVSTGEFPALTTSTGCTKVGYAWFTMRLSSRFRRGCAGGGWGTLE